MDSINQHIRKFSIVLDTNVLYAAPVRDIILRLAEKETFSVHWSEQILQELGRNLEKKPGLSQDKIESLITELTRAFPDARIDTQNIDPIKLSAEEDKHVVATAIQSQSEVIVTQNISDFPSSELALYNLEAQTPDEFLVHHFTLEETKTVRTVTDLLTDLSNPPYTPEEYLSTLEQVGLVTFAQLLRTSGFMS
jgi:predicted nucleic acid-binding protein